ncbi:MAG: peptidylprolyl isomerase, partial [Chitinophagia bacterium]|nr:peptidylprolyl isomerase [Chitinophagia bacterium]
RRGDEADVRHILIRPEITKSDIDVALKKLDSVYTLLKDNKLTFQEAVGKYATDDESKRTGGMILDPNTGSSDLEISKLDPVMVMLLDSMNVGGYSKPHPFYTATRDQACRIVYLKAKVPPHKANLQKDYGKIMEVAFAQKKQVKMQTWIKNKLSTFYLKFTPDYQSCTALKELSDAAQSN